MDMAYTMPRGQTGRTGVCVTEQRMEYLADMVGVYYERGMTQHDAGSLLYATPAPEKCL